MPGKQKITTCLWFDDNAEEAMEFYVSTFRNSRIVELVRHTDEGPGPKGTVMFGTFELEGQQFMAINGNSQFKLTEAVSLLVSCESQPEVDELWNKLTADGGSPSQCGWLKDKFGLSWQITPRVLLEMMTDKDRTRSNRVMQAMMQMTKIDIAKLKQAYDGR